MNRSSSNPAAMSIAVGFAVLLCACAGGSANEMLASAKSYLAKRDGRAALIQLRNAVQKDPGLAEARLLLGRTLLEVGDAKGAIPQLEKALELGLPQAQVLPLLARAWLQQGEAKTVVARCEGRATGDLSADAEIAVAMAQAYAMLGDRGRALQRIDAVLAASPDNTRALLQKARLLAQDDQPDAAIALVAQVTERDPRSADAWHLRALFASRIRHDSASAIDAWRRCLALRSDDVVAHTGIVTLLLQAGDLAQAKAQLQALQSVQPQHPQTRFLAVQMALAQRDIHAARSLAQAALKQQPDNAGLLEAAGVIEYEAGALSQANVYLNKALRKAPELVVARQLLARVYLRAGQPTQALTVLQPRLAGDHRDLQALTLAAEASLQSGDIEKADTYFERAAKASKNDSRLLASRAVARLAQGRNDAAALDDLQRLAARDDEGPAALALITERWRRKDFDGALKAIDALEHKQPDRPFVAVLRGRLLLARHDVAGARASLEHAQALDPTYFPATAGLVAADLLDKKPDEARKRLEALLQGRPGQPQALLALAEVRARTGASKEEVRALLKGAVGAAPADAEPRVLLVRHYLQSRDAPQALAAAQEAAAAVPDNAEVLSVLASAQAASGETEKAIATLNTLAQLLPESPQPHLRLGEMHLANHDSLAASESLKRALEISPGLLPAQIALVQAAIAAHRRDYALDIARLVRKQHPAQTIGLQLEGDVQAANANWDAAVEAFRTAQRQAPSGLLAARLEQALIGAGRKNEAAQMAAEWQRTHLHDPAAIAPLAEAAMARREFEIAEARYRTVLNQRPRNVIALNNLAWLMVQQKKPGAVAVAREAEQLAPEEPAILDTLALALADEEQLPEAVEVQKRAVSLAPDTPGLRLHLARLLIRAGDKAVAKAELLKLAQLGNRFSAQAEVARLLQSM